MLEMAGVTKEYAAPNGPLAVLSGVSLQLKRGDAADAFTTACGMQF